MEMRKKEAILKNHPYKIWQDSTGKWYTYLPDEKRKRVLRKRQTKKAIEDVIVSFYKEQEENPTIKDLFNEWLTAKVEREEISLQTKERYERQYEQCFCEFGTYKIKSISEYDIEDFVLDAIHKHRLTQKGFSNMRTLLFGIFKTAKKKRLVSFSITEVMSDIELSRKCFRKTTKKDSEEVFMVDELPKITNYLEENKDIVNLGILLLFKTGLRIGELAALKQQDITDNVIHVCRTEIRYKDEQGQLRYEVRDFPKTEAGVRDVVIPDNCKWIIKAIKRLTPFGKYLFESNGERIRTYVFRGRLYRVCAQNGIERKSPHKIRKTYGSILLDGNVPESTIVSQMGHTTIDTTKRHYYKNRRDTVQISDAINSVDGLAN